ncbi:MAG: polyprenyl synthetase family protein [Phycisphaerae bacterium]|nr:polyprenyl synthetase family protein [Phycisphaerae bacterium]
MIQLSTTLTELYAPIGDELAECVTIFDAEIESDLPFLGALCDTVRSYRGKMLRPALLLLSGKAAGRLRPAHPALAAVVEMVHMATLVHDDVLDEATERRRQPTVGRIAGNVAAVLLGDFLISHAFHLCSSLDDQYASRRIGAATNEVCEGELLQNHHAGTLDVTEATYFEILKRKTGALTAVSCELGARFAGADQDVIQRMREFGLSAGVAFQIVDDVLDVTGSEAVVGKTLGRDAALGKVTLPVIHALHHTSESVARKVKDLLLTDRSDDSLALRSLLSESGSLNHALDAARGYVSRARTCLSDLPDSDAKASLAAMADFIVDRSF